MAPATANPLSFDEILSRDREERERKQNQEKANVIFSKPKKEKPLQNGDRKFVTGASLASRVGISKQTSQRSLSNPPQFSKPEHLSPSLRQVNRGDLQRPSALRHTKQDPLSEKAKHDLLSESLVAKGATNHSRPRPLGPEINIRGAAGPYIVHASNFAPGTTAADIESAMVPNSSEIQSCRILLATPTVMAEMVFPEKQNAEKVIETFNNKKADGRVLHLYMKAGGPSPVAEPATTKEQVEQSPGEIPSHEAAPGDKGQPPQTDRTRRRAEPEIQDGRFGFASKDEMEVDAVEPVQPATQERRNDRRDTYQEERYRRGEQYAVPPQSYSTNGYYDRGWGGGRSSYNRPSYNDGYSRSRYRGSGYR